MILFICIESKTSSFYKIDFYWSLFKYFKVSRFTVVLKCFWGWIAHQCICCILLSAPPRVRKPSARASVFLKTSVERQWVFCPMNQEMMAGHRFLRLRVLRHIHPFSGLVEDLSVFAVHSFFFPYSVPWASFWWDDSCP